MDSSKPKYIHSDKIHTLDSPREIVPHLVKAFHPKSVVDVGCGLGTFLHVFLENNINDVLGIDGGWAKNAGLLIPGNFFLEKDLEQKFQINRKFDLVICLEVAEHLSAQSADQFINNLIMLGNNIVFSAAPVNQGGQNHINEQHVDYWVEKFSRHDFVFHDVFRNYFWNNKKIDWWYRQNMFLVAHKDVDLSTYNLSSASDICEYIHPELLELETEKKRHLQEKMDNLIAGKLSGKLYFQMLQNKLKRSIFKIKS